MPAYLPLPPETRWAEEKGWWILHLLKGAEQGYEEAISQLGQSGRLIPKRILLIVVPDKLVDKTVKTIIRVNQTGKSGDGKIFVMPCHGCHPRPNRRMRR